MQANNFLSFPFGYMWWSWVRSAPLSDVMVKDVSWMEESSVVVHPLSSSRDCLSFSIPACMDVSVLPGVSRKVPPSEFKGVWSVFLVSCAALRPVPGPPLIEAGGCAWRSCWDVKPKYRWRSPSESLPKSTACDGKKDSLLICSKLHANVEANSVSWRFF